MSLNKSKTNVGFLGFVEIIIRSHPLIYYFSRKIVRYTNIFEEDMNGVSFLNFDKKINILDVGASDGIATKFFQRLLNVNKVFCFEPHPTYIQILKKIKNCKIKIEPYAIGNKTSKQNIYFPRYKFYSLKFDLIPYTFYSKKVLDKYIDLDFRFKKNISIIKKKITIKKFKITKLKIHLIKVDVNGFEKQVLEGLTKIIRRDKPAIIVETNDDINLIQKKLNKYGYFKIIFDNKNKKFQKMKKSHSLNTYFIQKKHLDTNCYK